MLKEAFANNKEDYSKMVTTLTKDGLNREFDDGFGGSEGEPFTAWGEKYVYFPVVYDGSEWWDYKEKPKEPTEAIELKALTVNQADDLGYNVSCGWENLLAINGVPS